MRRHLLWATALLLVVCVQTIGYLTWGAERVQGNVAALTIPIAAWFCWLYMHDPWWRSWFGRSLMALAAAIWLACVATVLFRLFGDYWGRDLMLIVSADLTFAAMLARTLVLRSEQKADDSHAEYKR